MSSRAFQSQVILAGTRDELERSRVRTRFGNKNEKLASVAGSKMRVRAVGIYSEQTVTKKHKIEDRYIAIESLPPETSKTTPQNRAGSPLVPTHKPARVLRSTRSSESMEHLVDSDAKGGSEAKGGTINSSDSEPTSPRGAVPLATASGLRRHSGREQHQLSSKHGDEGFPQYFGVFDGHAGDKCSQFLKDNLHSILASNLDYKQGNYKRALREAFGIAEQQFLHHVRSVDILENSGACAQVLLVVDGHLLIANCGDCRSLLLRRDKTFKALTTDHRPTEDSEAQRVEKAGGKIINGRVWGNLGITRSIGDPEIKMIKEYAGSVIAVPDLFDYPLKSSHHFIVLCCDGIWDSLSNEEVANVVKQTYTRTKSLRASARAVVDLAVKAGSEDDCTCMVLLLEHTK